MNRHFASRREFTLIESLFDASHFSGEGHGLGDDAFILESGGLTWAVTTDSSVEGIHYRFDWGGCESALEKALLSNLSDINAMGGASVFAFFNLGALKSWDSGQVSRLGARLAKLEADHGFRVAGGDTVLKDKESFFNFTIMGRIPGKALLRSQARPGHRIYVSGSIGRSAAGLSLFQQGYHPDRDPVWAKFFRAHLLPSPPLGLGLALGACQGPVAAIDISDGLSSELEHLSRQSGCRLVVEWSKLGYDGELSGLPGGGRWKDWVLHGGEEYQLLFTGDFTESELRNIAVAAGPAGYREIGRVQAGQGVGIIDEAGKESELEAKGWSH